MKKVLVLGAGMVGSAIARDLCNEYFVTAADIDPTRLEPLKHQYPINIKVINKEDNNALLKAIEGHDLVIGAVPGHFGFENLKTIILSGHNIVDISFFNEDPFELDELAKSKNITAIFDCGVAPGLSNIILGHHNSFMDITHFECMVGGLPVKRTLPYQYKAPFSPIDVIEEYTRPARIVENGRLIIKPALSDAELVEINEIGTLESFNTDGLRSLLVTMEIPFMKEKTLRYPGHIDIMRVLRDSGFFSKIPVHVQDKTITPIDITSELLFPIWKLEENEPEFTVMCIKIKGTENGIHKEIHYTIFDKFDDINKISSMARTTGYTCTAAARLILEDKFNQKGIIPPEFIGADNKSYKKILEELQLKNIRISVEEKIL